MPDVGRLSVGELVGKVLADEHADVLRQAVVWLAQELMEAEGTAAAGAGDGERDPERTTRRNGYRQRAWATRVGSIELAIPKVRQGSSFPSLLEPHRPLGAGPGRGGPGGLRQRRLHSQSGPAGGGPGAGRGERGPGVAVVGWAGCAGDGVPGAAMEGACPYLWLDAKVEKVRAGGRVEHRAVVSPTGRPGRPARGHRPRWGAAETEAFWREVLRGLVRRGLAGGQLVVSDAHQGLKQAIAQVLGAPWQGCTVHFLGDALGHCPKDLQQLVGAALRPSSGPASSRRPGGCSRRRLGTWRAGCPRWPGGWWNRARPAGLLRVPRGPPVQVAVDG
jgi:putative transposase